jgi:hypothetical protein
VAKQPKSTRPGKADESTGARLIRLTAAWKAAFDALVAARVGFLALCDEPDTYGPQRDKGEQAWRDAEAAESKAAAEFLEVWTGGSGDGDAVADVSEVEVDPAAALTFWKRADWAGYCGWAAVRLAHPERPVGESMPG